MNKFLSAEELRDKRFLPRNLPEKAAAKGCGPDDDVVGDFKLERLLDEHLTALSEPKVEKLNYLIKGEWLPDKRVVRVVKQVGKHLQHMGHTVNAQHMLYLEEAMFLMDTKCMEVYYKDIPLSEQEAYSVFFGCEADLHKYQVYAHLSRLGYTVVRHRGRSTISDYERTIKLDKYLKHGQKTLKIQQDSPKTDLACGITQISSAEADMVTDDIAAVQNLTESCTGKPMDTSAANLPCLLVRHPEITIPDAYGKSLFALLAAQPHHLPPNVVLHKEMYTVDLSKLYARQNMSNRGFKVHCSRKAMDSEDSLALRLLEAPSSHDEVMLPKLKRHCNPGTRRHNAYMPNRNNASNDFGRYHPRRKRDYKGFFSGGKTPMVLPKSEVKTNAVSWKQYKQEVAGAKEGVRAFEQLATPNVRPLLEPVKATSTAAILSELQIVKPLNFTESSRVPDLLDPGLLDLTYDVYLPSTEYKKNATMLPNHRLVVTSASEPLPEPIKILRTMHHLQDGVAIHFAVVNGGDVAFYSFKEVQLPVLVSMG